MSKTLIVLSLYRILLQGKLVSKEEFSNDHGVATRAFDRYVADIRTFLEEEQCDKELIFDKYKNGYRMIDVNI